MIASATKRSFARQVRAIGPLPSWRLPDPPEPESLKLIGTTWYARSRSYWPRRLYASIVYATYSGVALFIWIEIALLIGEALLDPIKIVFYCILLGVIAPASFAIATKMSLRSRRIDWDPIRNPERAAKSPVLLAGFPIVFVTSFLFSLVEAPGEHRARLRHAEAMRRWEERQERVRRHRSGSDGPSPHA